MRRMRHITALAALLLVSSSCGGDERAIPPFTIQINSMDVIQAAVDRIEIIIHPEDLDRRFRMVPDMTHEGGSIQTRVTAAGEFVITVEREYLDANVRFGATEAAFILDVPVQASEEPDDGSVSDPRLEVFFVRGSERIATHERLIEWPLTPGNRAIVMVRCIRPEFARQCTNNDPIPGSDAGTPPPDGG